jgi:hypothetical protein
MNTETMDKIKAEAMRSFNRVAAKLAKREHVLTPDLRKVLTDDDALAEAAMADLKERGVLDNPEYADAIRLWFIGEAVAEIEAEEREGGGE